MTRSSEEGYAVFRWIAGLVTRRYKALVVFWVLVFGAAIVANQLWPVGDVVSFEQSAILPQDTESARAQGIIEEQFPGQLANSSATIVLVANDTTTEYYRWFVADLHDAIVLASALEEDESGQVGLRVGGNLTVDRPIRFLRDPSEATIYGVYEAYAFELAKQFNAVVRGQVLFTEGAAGVFWGVPGYHLGAWLASGDNDTAYNETASFIASAFPPESQAWAASWLDAYHPAWLASFSDPGLASLLPDARAEAVLGRAMASYVPASFPPEAQGFLLGMTTVFTLRNFQDGALVEDYALTAFRGLPVAEEAFFRDLYLSVPEDATDEELRAFARIESREYGIDETPLLLPFDVTTFYVSEDRRIQLMNYGFDREAEFRDASGREPIVENVLAMRDLVRRIADAYEARASVYVTGSAPSSVDQEEICGGGLEFVATIVLVIVLIGLYFRSLVSPAFPILTIGIAIMIANLFVWFVAVYLFSVDFTVTAVLQTVLLATGTDYSIFLISRYRDERQDGRNRAESVRNAVVWAGESIATSGGAVLISFAALSLGSFPLVRTMGITIGFSVTIAIGLALTFIPAVLLLVGNRVFWPSGRRVARPRPKGQLSASERYFRGAAGFSMRHAKAVLAAAVLISVPATYLVLTDAPSYDFSEGAPITESGQGLDAISDAFGYGFIFPSFVVVRFPDPLVVDGNVSVPLMFALANLSAELHEDPGVKSIEGPTNPQGSEIDFVNLSGLPSAQREAILLAMSPYIGEDNRTARLLMVLADPPFSRDAISTIDGLSVRIAAIHASEPQLRRSEILLGGVSAVLNDVRDNTNRDLQLMAVVVITGLFIVLLFVLGSVLIPIRAILTILLSISWTMGLTIVVFHAWKGLDTFFILPLALFVMAMGLGMDYDIFIITRVREEVAKGKSDRDAITEAMTRTGGIISACGIVMAGAFATLMISPQPFLQEIGFALAFAILLDSTVVRIYLVPAIMVLAGRSNWWAPGRLQRVRREPPPKPQPESGDP